MSRKYQTLEIMFFVLFFYAMYFVLKTSKLCYLVRIFVSGSFYRFVHCHFNMWIIGAFFAADFYMWVSSTGG